MSGESVADLLEQVRGSRPFERVEPTERLQVVDVRERLPRGSHVELPGLPPADPRRPLEAIDFAPKSAFAPFDESTGFESASDDWFSDAERNPFAEDPGSYTLAEPPSLPETNPWADFTETPPPRQLASTSPATPTRRGAILAFVALALFLGFAIALPFTGKWGHSTVVELGPLALIFAGPALIAVLASALGRRAPSWKRLLRGVLALSIALPLAVLGVLAWLGGIEVAQGIVAALSVGGIEAALSAITHLEGPVLWSWAGTLGGLGLLLATACAIARGRSMRPAV